MKHLTLLLLLILTLVACGTAEQTVTTVETAANEVAESVDTVQDETTNEVAESADTVQDETTNEVAESADIVQDETTNEVAESADIAQEYTAAAWQTAELVDAQTGETFTFADYAGETVFVEPFATWCGNCKNQLFNIMNGMNAVHSGGNQNVNYVVLSVETNLANEQLAQYANAQGFPFQFAVATPELLRLLVDEFGSAVTSAPSTPHFIIRPDGTTTELATGLESAEEIADELLSIQ